MKRIAMSLLIVTLSVGIGVSTGAGPAVAANATVGNGLTTTDLSAVGMSPGALASTLVGAGVTVSNVTYSGANAQAGLIHLVDPAVVSFNDGIILSSGNIADVVGPNKSDGITGDMAGPADPDLDALIANTQTVNPVTFDAASLEFDFVPSADQVYFTYTFASDEYLEWVNLFNDVFAFYVNGQNCATVAGGAAVSIDTINDAVNPSLFRDNSFSSPPPNPINIESDGLSVELICSAPVNAGQTNHMKLAIADTSDQILDSVVMIKAQSVSTVKPESCNDGVDNDDDTLIDDGDPSCQATTTPPPIGSGGIGSGGNPPAFTGNEGTPIGLDAAALGWVSTPDTLNTTWTVTGINGTVGSCAISPADPMPLDPDGTVAVVSTICPDDGEYVARLDGWDVQGHGSFGYDVDFFVHNAPPAVTIDAPTAGAQAAVGVPVSLSATVTDPGVDDTITCQIDWGDGSSEAGTLTGGSCTGAHAYGAEGAQVLTVTATDNAGDSGGAATVVTTTAATTDVAPSITTHPTDVQVLAGQPYGFAAAASGQPTPAVQWQESADAGATWADVPGATTVPLAGTASSTQDGRQYRAVFTNAAGTAATAAATLTVVQSVVTLTPSTPTPAVGEPLVLTASVADATTPTALLKGTMTFRDGATVLGTKTVTAGTASLTTGKLAVGPHSVTASYLRTPTSTPVASPAVAVTVVPAATTADVTSTVNPSVYGQSTTLKATVKRVAPATGAVTSGTVDFYDDGVFLATKPVVNGVASLPTRSLTAGSHTIGAMYSGSATDNGVAAAPLTQTVGLAPTAVTLTSSSPTSVFSQKVTFKAVVKRQAPSSGAASGTVDFYDELGPIALGVPLSASGVATVKTSNLPVGLHVIHADFSGTANELTSHATVLQTVNPASTVTKLAASPLTTTAGKPVTLTVTVARVAPATGLPTGTVTVLDNGQPTSSAPLVNGKAVIKTTTLGVGAHSLTAVYGGDGNDDGSASGAVTVTVT